MTCIAEIKKAFADLKKTGLGVPVVTKNKSKSDDCCYDIIINHENSYCNLYDYSSHSIGPYYMAKVDEIAKRYGYEVEHENPCIVGLYKH
jgi:hypothetical protein